MCGKRVGLLWLTILWACADVPAPNPTPEVVITASVDTLTALGYTVTLNAWLRTSPSDSERVSVSTWTSGDPSVATVDANGLATARAEGQALITARTPGSLEGHFWLHVRQRALTVRILASTDTVREVDTLVLGFEAFDALGNPISGRLAEWSVAQAGRARVEAGGPLLIGLRRGSADVRAVVDGVAGSRTFIVADGFLVRSLSVSTYANPLGTACAVDLDSIAACWLSFDSVATNVSDTLRVRSWTSGDRHSCGITADGRAFCRGSNTTGQLGLGLSGGIYDTIVPAGAAYRFRSILAADHLFTCGVTTTSQPLCWGHNDVGQLGRNSRSSVEPQIAAVLGVPALDTVDADGLNACGLAPGGAPYCWGEWRPSASFDTVAVPVPGGATFARISVGTGSACGLTDAGAAFCWGYNYHVVTRGDTPAPVSFAGNLTQISAGQGHACAVTDGAQVVCWGVNDDLRRGVLGSDTVLTPEPVPGLPPVVAVAAGHKGTCVITVDRAVLCWGNGSATPRRILRSAGAAAAVSARAAPAENLSHRH